MRPQVGSLGVLKGGVPTIFDEIRILNTRNWLKIGAIHKVVFPNILTTQNGLVNFDLFRILYKFGAVC